TLSRPLLLRVIHTHHLASFPTRRSSDLADPAKLAVWQPILSQYRPTFLGQCENAIRWSGAFVRKQLETVMFNGDPKAKEKARKRSEEHTSELQSPDHLVCRLLLEKKKLK